MRLSAAQRSALQALADDGGFVDYKRVMNRRDTRIVLNQLGLTEPRREGPVTSWFMIRITDKGRAALAASTTPSQPFSAPDATRA